MSDDPDDYFDQPSAIFSQFSILDIDAVRKLVTNAPTKTCPLDPLPTVLLKTCLEDILPTLTNMLNLSMQTGEFHEVWKEALVTPILKREGLDTIFKNYRPISNLQFVSKLVDGLWLINCIPSWQKIGSYLNFNPPIDQDTVQRQHCLKSRMIFC